MDEKGLSEEEVFGELNCFSDSDSNFRKVLSSMCTPPHPIAVKAYYQFIHSNIGDPGLFQGTYEMENEIIRIISDISGHPNPISAFGHLTSGGTESNIEAIFHMKNRYIAFHTEYLNEHPENFLKSKTSELYCSKSSSDSSSDSSKLNLVLPKTAHFSFEKIANLLDIQLKKAAVDSKFKVIPESVESLIDEKTIGIVGIAGNTEFGEIDPIEQLSEVALKYDLPLHIDAAFGGFIFPFLENSKIRFGFDIPGVTSLSIDPHKMGLSVIPAGVLIFRDESFLKLSLDKIKVKTPYLTGKYQSTLTGTRPGAAVASTYAVMKYLGKEGYRKNVAYCMDLTNYFQKELNKIGLFPSIPPVINIVTVTVGDYEKTDRIRSLLLERYGWNVSATKTIPALRFVLMPHVTKEDICSLISDLKTLLDSEC